MSWRDDSWRDTYDVWKLRSPYDDEPQEEECHHEEYEIDYEGRAQCNCCGEGWWATADEIAAERERHREYDEFCRREERRERWRRFTPPIRWPIYRLLSRLWPRKACAVLHDDEVPF